MISKAIDETKTTQETTQEKILKLIKENNAITQTEMAKILKITRDGVAYNIKILKNKGIIERIGATKSGIWKINELVECGKFFCILLRFPCLLCLCFSIKIIRK